MDEFHAEVRWYRAHDRCFDQLLKTVLMRAIYCRIRHLVWLVHEAKYLRTTKHSRFWRESRCLWCWYAEIIRSWGGKRGLTRLVTEQTRDAMVRVNSETTSATNKKLLTADCYKERCEPVGAKEDYAKLHVECIVFIRRGIRIDYIYKSCIAVIKTHWRNKRADRLDWLKRREPNQRNSGEVQEVKVLSRQDKRNVLKTFGTRDGPVIPHFELNRLQASIRCARIRRKL